MDKILLALAAIAILTVVAIAGIYFNNNFEVFVVRGESMKPTFGNCTIILSDKSFPPSQIQTGDIVVIDTIFMGKEQKFAHRVVENNVQQRLISTRGDNDAFYDFPSSLDGFFVYPQVLGKVTNFWACPLNSGGD